MIEAEIVNMLKNRRRYESEIMILRDCSDELNDSEVTTHTHRYAILKRRLSLIDHWLHYLPEDDRIVVDKHLIQGWTFPRIVTFILKSQENEMPCDARTLHRAQARALKKLVVFMNARFADSLDFLVDSDDYDKHDNGGI